MKEYMVNLLQSTIYCCWEENLFHRLAGCGELSCGVVVVLRSTGGDIYTEGRRKKRALERAPGGVQAEKAARWSLPEPQTGQCCSIALHRCTCWWCFPPFPVTIFHVCSCLVASVLCTFLVPPTLFLCFWLKKKQRPHDWPLVHHNSFLIIIPDLFTPI